jgi:hypothetical protein
MKSPIKITIATITLVFVNACSTSNILATSQIHTYNNDFGLVQNHYADTLVQEEYLAMNKPTEIDIPILTDPNFSTELKMEPGAFLAEDYVQVPEIITYKYKFDPKFYSKAEWRTMNLQ